MPWRRWRISALRQLQLRDNKSGFSKVTCIERVFRPLVPRDAKPHNLNLLTHCPAISSVVFLLGETVTDLLRGNWCNGFWGKLAMGKLLTCCGLATGKSPTCYILITDLSFMLRTCYGLVLLVTQQESCQLVTDLLWGNWCNVFWPLLNTHAESALTQTVKKSNCYHDPLLAWSYQFPKVN